MKKTFKCQSYDIVYIAVIGMAVLLSCFFPQNLGALERGTPLKEYLGEQWDYKRDFRGNCVNGITQTPKGYLWLATDVGVFRFDGTTFEALRFEDGTIQSNMWIGCIAADRSGTIWAGSAGEWSNTWKTAIN